MSGLRAPAMAMNFPGANADYSSLLSYGGGIGYASPDYSLGQGVALTPQVTAGGASSVAGPSWWDSMLGYKNADGTSVNGWGGAAMGLIQGLGNAYMGMKQYGLAKDQLAFSKQAFERNFGAQKAITNANLEDRQRARVASNPGAYQSVGEYMQQNGVR